MRNLFFGTAVKDYVMSCTEVRALMAPQSHYKKARMHKGY